MTMKNVMLLRELSGNLYFTYSSYPNSKKICVKFVLSSLLFNTSKNYFRSRTPKADKKYMEKGEEIMKKLCWPEMKRFNNDIKHDMGELFNRI